MQLVLIASFVVGLLLAASRAAPSVSVISDTQLDAKGIFFVSYDGVVNVNSFQLSGVLTHSNYQYAAWYTSTKYAILGRRQLPSGGWSTLQLPHQLSTSDSHNVIALGISPSDGKVHVALDCHSTKLYYTSSEAGLATSGASWTASRFGSITNTLGNLNIGRLVGYAYFIRVSNDHLSQFQHRYVPAIRGHPRQSPTVCLSIWRIRQRRYTTR